MMRLLRLEWRRSLSDRLLWLTVALFAALLAAAAFNGARDTAAARAAMLDAQAHESRALAELKRSAASRARGDTLAQYAADGSNPARVGGGDGARRAALPRADFDAFATGYSATLPQSHRITTWTRHTRTDGYVLSSPANNAAGRFDYAFVCVLLLPLFAIALAYDVVSSDRESGVLRLVGAHPVALGRVMLARLTIRFTLLCAPLLACGAMLYGWSAEAVTLPGIARGLVLAAMLCLYAAFWLAACGAINTLGRSSSFNAMPAVALYLALVVLVPNAAQLTAAETRPLAHGMTLPAQMRAIDAAVSEKLGMLIQAYYVAHPEIPPPDEHASTREFRTRLFPKNVEFDRRLAPVLARRAEGLREQFSVVRTASFLSPPLALELILEQWSGNDLARNLDFERQLDAFQRQWREFFGGRIMGLTRLKPDDYERLPVFGFSEEPDASFWMRALIPLAALSVACTLLIAWCAARLSRKISIDA